MIKMDIDPEYKDLVHTDATALLRPKTGLKDMFIDLAAGRRRRAGRQARASRSRSRATQPDVNPDEILSVLDADTRDYLQLLVNGARPGPQGPRRRPARPVRALRADPPRPRARQRRGRDAPQAAAPPRQLAEHPLNGELAHARRRPRAARRLLLGRASTRSPPRSRPTSPPPCSELPEHADADDRHARPRRHVRRAARPDDREAAPGGARARPRQPGGAPVRQGGRRRSCARASARSCASRARSCATCARSPRRLAEGGAGPDAGRSCASTTSSTCSATTRTAARARTRPPARRATCSGWRGCNHSATQLFSTSDANGVFRPVTIAAPCATLAAGARRRSRRSSSPRC